MRLMEIIWNGRGATKTVILAAIFALLLAVTIVQRSQRKVQAAKEKAKESAPIVAEFKPDDVYSIEIFELLQKTVLQKRDGKWLVGFAQIMPNYSQAEKEKTPISAWDNADEDAVREVLEIVKDGFKGAEIVSKNREKKVEYRVGILGSKFMFKNEKGEPIACIDVGEKSSDFTGTYVSLCDKDEVYKVSGILDYIFKKDVNGWRDKQVFNLDKLKIAKVEASGAKIGEKPISAVKGSDGKWTGISPAAFPVDDATLDALLTKISTYKATGFPERMDPNDTLKNVELEIAVTMDDASIHTLTFGTAERAPDKLVKGSDKPSIYATNPNDVDELSKNFLDLLNPPKDSASADKSANPSGEQPPQ